MSLFARKTRFFLRLVSVFWKRQRKIIAVSTIGTILLVIGIGNFLVHPSKKTDKIGIVGKFDISSLPDEVLSLIGDGLTKTDETGLPMPAIAEKWERSQDGREYVFFIKSDLRWQDGTEVIASDLEYNFSDVAISRPDKKQIKFTLKEAFSPFPVILSKPLLKKGLIGTGEYKVKSLKKSGSIVQLINLITADNKSSDHNIEFRFYPTEKAAKIGFKLGEIDILRDVSDPEELTNWPKISVTKQIREDRFVAIIFNNQDKFLGEKTIRQALAYAIKNRWEDKALGPINPNSWAYNPNVKPYKYDPENAKKLLQKVATDGIKLEEITLSTSPSFLEEAELIKNDWEEIGIKTKINTINSLEDNFQAVLIAEKIPVDPDQYSLWHSTQSTNICAYKSPKVDKLLEDGRKTENQADRKIIYFEFQKTLLEDEPVIFLFHPTTYSISRR